MTTALRVKENWKTTCTCQRLWRNYVSTGKGSSPQGLSPPPSESPAPTFNYWQVAAAFQQEHLHWLGGGWHSSSFYFWAALLKSSVKLVPFSLIQPQVPVSVYGYKNKARRTKQKGGQTTTAAGLRRWRQAIENLCLLRCVGKLRARLRNPEEVHTLPVLPSQWEHYFPILKTKQMD